MIGLPASSRTTIEITLMLAPLDAGIVAGDTPTVLLAALAGPGVPVAVKVTGLPLTFSAETVAVSVLAPATSPKVQPPTAATPSAPVVADAPVTAPPPAPIANVTATPATGVPPASRTTTAGGVATVVPTVADWPSPADAATEAGAPTPSDTGVLRAEA